MVTRDTAWEPGTPCWVDLGTDVAKAKVFYSALFGWQIEEGDPQFGGYANCFVDGRPVAGLGPLQEGQETGWVTYLSTTDLDATLEKVTAAGGKVFVPPMEIGEMGAMAIAADSTCATFGLWRSGIHTGMRLANEVGAVTWNEHLSTDYDKAKQFYADVLGYSYQEVGDDGFNYATIVTTNPEWPVGGIGGNTDKSGWTTYFQVSDADAAVAKVQELGGKLVSGPTDSPHGRNAVVTDDQGAEFVVIAVPSQQ
ncbi:VOC family protein [Actinokineospora auranticolor]|uniref:VOC domain-containing protein n=1 Tax=Actinokineospora auranticolor TaxID=155976 RepID=A0A2S6GHH3_9PSEU|nr:VOC family protein [Actinokineospora auranticolor]PPK64682.1 hypothetical protein CLV40_11872 [Actinokineospora auranticolor]